MAKASMKRPGANQTNGAENNKANEKNKNNVQPATENQTKNKG